MPSKSRLALPEAARRQIVQAMAADTLASLRACPEIATISVLVRDRDLISSSVLHGVGDVVVQPDATRIARRGARLVRGNPSQTIGQPLAVVVADLPALTVGSLSKVLRQAQQHPAAMVADRHDSGTTVLTALVAADLDPHFGATLRSRPSSRRSDPDCRPADVACDVDTLADLAHARWLGVGPDTATRTDRSRP